MRTFVLFTLLALAVNSGFAQIVQGKVVLAVSGAPAKGAKVYFIEKTGTSPNFTLAAIDSTVTDTSGAFFDSLSPSAGSALLIKAALPSSHVNYATNLPTYYTSSLNWSGATTVTLPNISIHLQLIGGTNPGGPAFIGGSVLLGANKTTGVGDPLPSRLIILTNASNAPIAYTYTNAQGVFAFPNLAYGTYKVFGEVMGKTSGIMTITLSAADDSMQYIVFEENSKTFDGKIVWPASVNELKNNVNSISVYPVPAKDVIILDGIENIAGTKQVKLHDITGAIVMQQVYGNKEKVSIPISNLPGGVYMLQVNTAEGNKVFRVLK
jgi:hypothetical protein